jgi:predicted nucleic acid-binding protein
VSAETWAVDTSVAVPLLVDIEGLNQRLEEWLAGRPLCLTTHSLAETYAVLTRLHGDARMAPADAVRAIDGRFGAPAALPPETAAQVHRLLAARGISGGAVYDALVALAAAARGVPLASRDARAVKTYEALGARVEVLADT